MSNRTATKDSPSFFWQGVLILLPIAALAATGFFTLRQDRLLAEAEARQAAQGHADAINRIVWMKLNAEPSSAGETTSTQVFQLDRHGRLVHPPPAPSIPAPHPLDLDQLAPEERELWLAAFSGESDPPMRTNAIAAARRLTAASLPADVAGMIRYRLAILLVANGETAAAIDSLAEIDARFPETVSESGLPLRPLAAFKRLELTLAREPAGSAEPAALSAFCSNLVFHPSFLSPHLLTQTRDLASRIGLQDPTATWRHEWARHEALRPLATAALEELSTVIRSNASLPINAAAEATQSFLSSAAIPLLFWFETRELPGSTHRRADVFPAPKPGPDQTSGQSSGNRQVALGSIAELSKRGSGSGSTNPLPLEISPPPNARKSHFVSYEWLGRRFSDEAGGFRVVCRRVKPVAMLEAEKASPFLIDLRESLPVLPEWFGYSLFIAGRTVIADHHRPTTTPASPVLDNGKARSPAIPSVKPEILGTSSHLENGVELLRVNVLLLRPQLLFERQTARTRLFGALIGVSAVVAIAGFVLARRAFHRQRQLAEMKSNFVSSVSHELRAPIASVRLMAESLDRGAVQEPAKQHEYFRFIVQECRRLGTLIENVLDFARIEQGRKRYEFDPTDVPALIHQTVKLMEPAATEKQVTLITKLPTAGASESFASAARLDGQAIQQALVNLIDNALKHSPAGTSIVIGLATSAPASTPRETGSSQPNGSAPTEPARGGPAILCLYVQDDGPGIPVEDHQRIFERFYRRGSELRRDTHGIGIGLSIVKHIVEAHRGRVIVESAPGHGSRFTIELPVENPMTKIQ